MMPNLAGKSVLVTGGEGFIGSHLTRSLVRAGCHVTILDSPKAIQWRTKDLDTHVQRIEEDVANIDIDALSLKIKNAHIIFHLAASGVNPSSDDSSSIVRTNVLGTHNMLQLSMKLKSERFVYCGSCFEYEPGNLLSEDMIPMPISEYGASKSAAWLLVQAFGRQKNLKTTSIRPFTAYGPFEAQYRLIPYTITRALDNSSIDATLGEQTRDFIFIDDLIQAFLVAGTNPNAIGETFNACSGVAISVKELISLVVKLTDSSISPNFGAIPYRKTEMWTLSGDPSKAKKILGWNTSTSLKNGLEKTIQWFKENRSLYSEHKG